MAFPTPQPGLVIGYDFLFREKADAGMDNASKPHPCAIILVVAQGDQVRVSLLAISHMVPRPGEERFRLKLTGASVGRWVWTLGNTGSTCAISTPSTGRGMIWCGRPPGGGFVEGVKDCAGRRVERRD